MPNVRLTACPVLCICPVCHERQRTEGNDNCQLRFHDDFSPLIPIPAQVRVRETENVGPARDDHETRIPTQEFQHASSRTRHRCVAPLTKRQGAGSEPLRNTTDCRAKGELIGLDLTANHGTRIRCSTGI
jgi:hypothetical protein